MPPPSSLPSSPDGMRASCGPVRRRPRAVRARSAPLPLQAAVSADLRAAALPAGRADLLFLLAGQGVARLRSLPAAELVGTLLRETEAALAAPGPEPA